MKLIYTQYRLFIFLFLSTIISAQSIADEFLITSKSSSFSELETTYLSIYKVNAIAENAKINIKGDVLEHHFDKQTDETIKFVVTGQPAKVVLINEKNQSITILANHIVYEVETQLVSATENAHVSWNNSYVKGYKVVYKLDGSQVNCSSNDETNCENFYSTTDFNN